MVPVVRSAERTTLCRALLSCAELLPNQAVMFPVRMLSTAPELTGTGKLEANDYLTDRDRKTGS